MQVIYKAIWSNYTNKLFRRFQLWWQHTNFAGISQNYLLRVLKSLVMRYSRKITLSTGWLNNRINVSECWIACGRFCVLWIEKCMKILQRKELFENSNVRRSGMGATGCVLLKALPDLHRVYCIHNFTNIQYKSARQRVGLYIFVSASFAKNKNNQWRLASIRPRDYSSS
jgi:hypothetical protein